MNIVYWGSLSRPNEEEKGRLRANGLTYFYELRDQEGTTYSIEKRVGVNNIGYVATNFKIKEVEEEGLIMDEDFFEKYNPKAIDIF